MFDEYQIIILVVIRHCSGRKTQVCAWRLPLCSYPGLYDIVQHYQFGFWWPFADALPNQHPTTCLCVGSALASTSYHHMICVQDINFAQQIVVDNKSSTWSTESDINLAQQVIVRNGEAAECKQLRIHTRVLIQYLNVRVSLSALNSSTGWQLICMVISNIILAQSHEFRFPTIYW